MKIVPVFLGALLVFGDCDIYFLYLGCFLIKSCMYSYNYAYLLTDPRYLSIVLTMLSDIAWSGMPDPVWRTNDIYLSTGQF